MKKKLTYKDFLQETLSDEPSKLYLSDGNGLTDFYLDVLSSKNPKVKRAVTKYGLAEQEIYTEASKIEDKVDRVIYAQDSLIAPRKEFALALVVDGGFDEYEKVLDNPLNCDAVIARAYDSSHYAAKK